MPSKSPSTPKVQSEAEGKNPFEEDEDEKDVFSNPFENSEELDESNPFYEPSPSPKKSSNPFEVSEEEPEHDSITPTSDRLQSPVDSAGSNRDRGPGRYKKKLQSPSLSGRKSPRVEKRKSPRHSPPPTLSSPEGKAKSARGTAHPTLTKEQDAASKSMAKAALSPG